MPNFNKSWAFLILGPIDDDDDDDDDDHDDDEELFLWYVFIALLPAGIIVRNPHHRESPTRLEQHLSLRRT